MEQGFAPDFSNVPSENPTGLVKSEISREKEDAKAEAGFETRAWLAGDPDKKVIVHPVVQPEDPINDPDVGQVSIVPFASFPGVTERFQFITHKDNTVPAWWLILLAIFFLVLFALC